MTVGFDEPILWITVVSVGLLAIAAGAALGMRIGRKPAGITRRATGLWLGLLLAFSTHILTHVVFALLFSVATDGAIGCTFLVTPIVYLPAAAALAAESIAWKVADRRAHVPVPASRP